MEGIFRNDELYCSEECAPTIEQIMQKWNQEEKLKLIVKEEQKIEAPEIFDDSKEKEREKEEMNLLEWPEIFQKKSHILTLEELEEKYKYNI